jgi:hypothetical protein
MTIIVATGLCFLRLSVKRRAIFDDASRFGTVLAASNERNSSWFCATVKGATHMTPAAMTNRVARRSTGLSAKGFEPV